MRNCVLNSKHSDFGVFGIYAATEEKETKKREKRTNGNKFPGIKITDNAVTF